MRLSILAILFCVVSTGLAFQPSVASFVFRGSIINRKPTFTAADFPPHHNTRTTVISATTDSEEWTKKRLHNTNWFRSAAVLLALGVVGVAQEQSPVVAVRAGAAIHLLAFGIWFGTIFYTTFILGLTMFKHLPRQTFGKLQSKLFPKYFSLCSTTIMLQVSGSMCKSLLQSREKLWISSTGFEWSLDSNPSQPPSCNHQSSYRVSWRSSICNFVQSVLSGTLFYQNHVRALRSGK
jgi:hypothetical protein